MAGRGMLRLDMYSDTQDQMPKFGKCDYIFHSCWFLFALSPVCFALGYLTKKNRQSRKDRVRETNSKKRQDGE